ncbi:hypothetical protein B0J15DRAFT_576457 [Fusarium solani]|uniref:Uncharacterized protein n=1 Tax=Fusarium solani TaxID=169388 RepID=A0A9P9RAY8_FUSSL|nr:uncharacterized protein B0J15DRAFT_576457 [Fusarium solani]KAH7271450.1 hypothetical protein B0J15DRAFT_576457 [Fusarium solani]
MSTSDKSIQYETLRDVVKTDTNCTCEEPPGRQSEVRDRLIPSGSSSSDTKRQNWRQHWKRIGLASIAAIVFGTMMIFASLAILVFLWQGAQLAERRQEPIFWQTIVFHGWAPQVVTICSAAIRIVMTLQNGFVVAAVAAIMLETSGASLVDTAMLSVERALGSSPLNLLPPALRRCSTREDRTSAILHLLLVTTALVISLASTFTSTILLSDFRSGLIASPSVTAKTGIDFATKGEYRYFGTSVVKSRPVANWRFAEARDGEGSPSTEGDTGDTYRSMLPFQDVDSRRLLEFYSGSAAVTNFRTVCVAPEFRNLTLARIQDPDNGGEMSLNVLADVPPSMDWKLKFEPIASAYKPSPVKARLLDTWHASTPPSWPLTLYYSIDDTFTPENQSTLWPYFFHRALLFNSTMLLNETDTGGDNLPESLRNLTTKKQGLWTKVINADGVEVFSATEFYFNNAGPRLYNVTMSGRGIKSEPTGDWRRGPGHENQIDILHQMGIGAAFEDRGILELTVGSHLPEGNRPYHMPLGPTALSASGTSSYPVSQFSWAFSDSWMTTTAMGSMEFPHPAHSSVFQSIIQQTEDPARAVQALMTRLYQMQYYDFLPDFDYKQTTKTIYSTERITPSRWTGLLIVFCLVAVHLLLVSITTVLFISRTRGSALGNIWQAVSQMDSAETKQILESTDSKRDEEVKSCVKAMGKDAGVYGMSRSVETGRMEIQLRERRKEIMDLQLLP